jgi:hypothetical protein
MAKIDSFALSCPSFWFYGSIQGIKKPAKFWQVLIFTGYLLLFLEINSVHILAGIPVIYIHIPYTL